MGNEYSEDKNGSIESSNNITDNLRKLVKMKLKIVLKRKLSALNIETSESINDDNSLTKEDLIMHLITLMLMMIFIVKMKMKKKKQ